MTAAGPSSAPHDLFQITIGRAKAWALALTSYFGSLAALIGGYFGLKKLFPDWNDALVLGIVVIPLVLTLLTVTLPAWLRHRRDRKLVEEGISGTLKDPEYFRIWPYEARDRVRYSRADGMHEEVLRWIREARSPVLYLTGRSGTGKSSLLNAWVLPKLEVDDPRYQTLVVRSYRDPLDELATGLGKPGVIWERPSSDLTAEPRTRLERAAAYLGAKRRLLIVLDQFEEYVILQESEWRAQLEKFLRDLVGRPIPSVTTLLVLRTDYLGTLDQLSLPLLRQRDNWREIGPFTQGAATAFLDGSGLELGPELRAEVLKEATEVEENPGLIRPITLNMLGLVLSRFEGRLPRGFLAGRLLTGYIRGELTKPEVRDHAVAIVREMVTNTGTKHPRSEAVLAANTKLDRALVRGCLLTLGSGGLVRPLDGANQVWEVAHDFVARLLAQVVGSWRFSPWEAVRPWIAPASLMLWLGLLFAVLPVYQTHITEAPFSSLRAMGFPAIQTDDGVRVAFPRSPNYTPWFHDDDTPPDKAALMLRNAVTYMKEIRGLKLDLSNTPIADLTPLSDLTDLKALDISETRVADLTPLASLTSLEVLIISTSTLWSGPVGEKINKHPNVPPISDLKALSNLTNLRSLDLARTYVKDVAPLAKLTNLQTLNLSGTLVTDAAPLGNLTNLEELDLSQTKVADLTPPMANLTSLKTLDLAETQVADLTPLANLTNLQTLNLSGTRVADLIPIANLTSLKTLYLSETQVADLTPLANLASLESLSIRALWISEDGEFRTTVELSDGGHWEVPPISDLKALSNLTNLRSLDLARTYVKDVAPLAKLTNLQTLNLSGTLVTDAAPLGNLTNLQSLDLSDARVSQVEIAKLKHAFAERGNRSVKINVIGSW